MLPPGAGIAPQSVAERPDATRRRPAQGRKTVAPRGLFRQREKGEFQGPPAKRPRAALDQTCDFYNFGGASCPGTDVCYTNGICLPPANNGYDNVPLEGLCNGASGGESCGLTGDGYTGACNDLGSGMRCHAFCTFAHPCTYSGATFTMCSDVFSPPFQGVVGACTN